MKIAGLYIYPLKSGRAMPVDRVEVTPRGLKNDRVFMVVDPATGDFITQRDNAKLALVGLSFQGAQVTLDFDGRERHVVHLDEITNDADISVRVWKSTFNVSSAKGLVNEWLSDMLGVPAILVHQRENQIRHTSQNWAPGGVVSFADGYPILVTSTSSLNDLNTRIVANGEAEVPMERFRPNIVLDGLDPWQEDKIQTLKIGDVELKFVRPCDRCVITTMHQGTGDKMGKEPLRTLAKFRFHAGDPQGVIFGENANPLTTGFIGIGQEVIITGTKPAIEFKIRA